jgi:photosystem II stability/assembly factor-like uncharacterized protein
LRTEQILRVYAAPDAWWASLAHGGLMRYNAQKRVWQRAGTVTAEASAPASLRRGSPSRKTKMRPRQLGQIVNGMAFSSARWLAATENGLLESSDEGATWLPEAIGPLTTLPVRSVSLSSNGERIWVVSLRGLVFSGDGGKSWTWHDLPPAAGGAVSLDVDGSDEDTVVAVARNGLYISRDAGRNWQQAGAGLPATPVQSFTISGSVYAAAMRTGGVFTSTDSGHSWTPQSGAPSDGFFSAVMAQGESGVIFAASATEGLYALQWSPAATAVPPIPEAKDLGTR